MENTGYVALSYQVALERKMDIVSNNIANVDTSGYRSSHMMFSEYVNKNPRQEALSQVEDYGNYRNFAPGALTDTGNTLDVALVGNGFMAVSTADGEKFTRNGNLSTNALGQLVTSAGDVMADTGGKPIVIPQDAGSITIAGDGTVSGEQGPLGQLKIVRFDKPQELKPVGNSLFETEEAGIADPETKVKQGAIEGSNVNAVNEMTNMIEIMRKYESVARILQNEHESQLSMIQKMSKV